MTIDAIYALKSLAADFNQLRTVPETILQPALDIDTAETLLLLRQRIGNEWTYKNSCDLMTLYLSACDDLDVPVYTHILYSLIRSLVDHGYAPNAEDVLSHFDWFIVQCTGKFLSYPFIDRIEKTYNPKLMLWCKRAFGALVYLRMVNVDSLQKVDREILEFWRINRISIYDSEIFPEPRYPLTRHYE